MESSDSQISGSCGASLSEPPDIRNWFPSYEDETFVLDTCENFGFCVSNGSESYADGAVVREENDGEEEILGESRETRKIDENNKTGNPNCSKILDSFQSHPLFSEPPDIRNWCSSYVYESPELFTSDDFRNSAFNETVFGEDAQATGDGTKEKVKNLGGSQQSRNSCELVVSQNCHSNGLANCDGSSFGDNKHENASSTKVMASSELPFLFSEPPKIRSWFPDYTYESPVLEVSDAYTDCLCKERESEEGNIPDADNDEEKELRLVTTEDTINKTVSDKLDKMAFEKCTSLIMTDTQETKSLTKRIHQAGRKKNHCDQGNPFSEKNSEKDYKTETLHGSEINSNKEVDDLSLNKEGFLNKLKHESSCKADFQSLQTSISTSKCDMKSLETSTKHVPDSNTVGEALRETSTEGTRIKESEQMTENGFIMTRKKKILKRANGENSLKGPEEILLGCSRNKGSSKTECGNDETVKRKVLAETTNIQGYEATQVTGKWRCPQKSKPYRGPPTKQLRLEQWFRKV